MELPKKKAHLESGLTQRDRAKSAASYIQSFVKTTKILRFLGCTSMCTFKPPQSEDRNSRRRCDSWNKAATPRWASGHVPGAWRRPGASCVLGVVAGVLASAQVGVIARTDGVPVLRLRGRPPCAPFSSLFSLLCALLCRAMNTGAPGSAVGALCGVLHRPDSHVIGRPRRHRRRTAAVQNVQPLAPNSSARTRSSVAHDAVAAAASYANAGAALSACAGLVNPWRTPPYVWSSHRAPCARI